MAFRNEATHFRATAEGREDAFHAAYEAALKKARGELGRTYPLLIEGREVVTGRTFDDVDPSDTREVVGRFAAGGAAEVDAAVQAARKAQPAWGATPWQERATIFDRAADLTSARKYDFAAWMTLENGKNRVEGIYDVDEAIDFLRFYASQLREHDGYIVRMGEPFPGEECTSVLRPWGVFGVLGPFNFPLAIPTGMTAGALITGNAAVLKPASDTPLVAWQMVRLLHEAGVPKGVLHYVAGSGRDVGQTILDHPDVDGVVFTGSRTVGMKGFASFVGRRPRPYIAEMGGKNAIVVTEKADLAKAVPGVARSAFGFGGQKCSACSRVYVHRSLRDRFVKDLVDRTRALKVLDPGKREADLGPVIRGDAVKTFLDAVEEAKRDGGKVLAGGRALKDGALAHGHFVEPTIVDGLPRGHRLFREELFVPFLVVSDFSDLDEVIDEVNAADYGLTSGIFSEDPAEVDRYFDRVHAGVVYANRARGGSTGAMVGGQSFGGWKFSGTTDRGAGGPWYLLQFLREQSRTIARR
ncbi:MAG TPA: aldehyde dehydrogenase family protein [Candidatus Thermoplasmatota archaeon]|nr:aldehyde dehydrogenase family protein [Candidatus Thermoplasmatota archaeon]